MNIYVIKNFAFILFLAESEALININITVASSKGGVKVLYGGADNKYVGEKEVKLYNITDKNLKKGVRVELGKEPKNVFLNDPTYYGNVFQKYNWTEVKRNVHVKSAKLQKIKNEKVVLTIRNVINNSTKKAKVGVNLQETVDTTVSTYWDKNDFQDEIKYKIKIHNFKTNLTFDNKWMDNNVKTIKSVMSVKSVGYINITPGSRVITKLTAKKTILFIDVAYFAGLVGNLMVNYAKLYGKYYFWAPAISDVMKAIHLNNNLTIKETIEVECYTDPIIEVIDYITGKNIPIMYDNKPFRKRKPKN